MLWALGMPKNKKDLWDQNWNIWEVPSINPKFNIKKVYFLEFNDFFCSGLVKKGERLKNWRQKLTRLGCFYVTAILSCGYGWGWFEPEVEMRLIWDLVEV